MSAPASAASIPISPLTSREAFVVKAGDVDSAIRLFSQGQEVVIIPLPESELKPAEETNSGSLPLYLELAQ